MSHAIYSRSPQGALGQEWMFNQKWAFGNFRLPELKPTLFHRWKKSDTLYYFYTARDKRLVRSPYINHMTHVT